MRSGTVAALFVVITAMAGVSYASGAASADSGRVAALFNRAMREFNTTDYRAALKIFERIDSAEHPNVVKYYKGVCLFQVGDYGSAIYCLSGLNREDTLYALASYYLGGTMLALHNPHGAVTFLENSLDADSSYLPARLEYIRTLCAVDSFEKAEQFANENENEDEALTLAQELVSMKKFADVYPYLALVVSVDSTNTLGRFLLGETYFQTGKYPDAERIYSWIASSFRPSPFVVRRLALCYGNMPGRGSRGKAISLMSRYLAVSRDTSTEDLEHIGAWYYQLATYDSAESYFRQAIKYNFSDPQARLNLGLALMKLGKYNEAIKSMSLAYSLSKSSMKFSLSILTSLGSTELMAKRIPAAIRDFKIVLRIEPNDPEAAYGLGLVYDQARDTLDAVYWYKRFMSIEDKSGLNPDFKAYADSRIDSLSEKKPK